MAIVKIGNPFRGSPSTHQVYREEEENDAQTTSSSSDSAETETSSSTSASSSSESDSAMGSNGPDLGLTEPIEHGTHLCQVRDQTCTLPNELYDLNGLSKILSVETWNNCLSEEERHALSGLLPDMDQETYVNTLSDLFGGKNFHFGSPMATFFDQLKCGLCDPQIVLYRRGLKFLQKRKYYHNLQNYHNSMLGSLMEMKDAWENCKGYTVQEKIRLLDVLKSQKSLANDENDKREFESETDSQEFDIYAKKKDKSKYGKDVMPDPVKTKEMVKGYGGNFGNVPYDYRGQKLGVKHAVTVAAFAPRSSQNSRKGKHFDEREDLAYPTNQGKRMQAAHLDPQKVRSSYKNNVVDMRSNGKGKMYNRNEETESDSSDQLTGSEEARKLNYSRTKNNAQEVSLPIKREYSEISREVEPFSAKAKKKSKTSESRYTEEEVQLVKRVYVPVSRDKVKLPPVESYTLERRRKPIADPAYISQQVNCDTNAVLSKIRDDLNKNAKLANNEGLAGESTPGYGENMVPAPSLSSCSKKSKGKVNIVNNISTSNSMQMEKQAGPFGLQSSPNQLPRDANMTKKKGKKKPDPVQEPVPVIPPEPALPEKNFPDPEPEPEPEKPVKKPPVLITPTIHTGFSFSIIHLLSAVRKAMISPAEEDGAGTGMGLNLEKDQFPSLTVQDIVNRVKLNPGDPFILETQEPLQDLVRGVLKILCSKTAPLGAKGWKQLVSYEKSNKTWTWVGPANPAASDNDPVEEDTSSDAWGIPHKMLVKLVDAFANWLKSGQDTLQQIGSLPAPPASLLSCPDEKERFKDLRAQKSLNTISPSSDEVRSYFHKEEVLRYSIPDRAFSYTTADGRKSTVAPLRRGGGKPTSKARDHFMLKPDRPPHVTILCLVRDAAARLPGSIGTRADVCTLLRDSQYIVEDVSDSQVNQVVSGALDRLHYERDPCVQFDADRKLWVYLHKDREEEDFEDDGTSSTKKWKRPRKDGTDTDAGAVVGGSCLDTDANCGTGTGGVAMGTTSTDPPVEKVEKVVVEKLEKVEKVESTFENITPASKSSARGPASTSSLAAGKAFGVGANFGTSTVLGTSAKMLCRENSTNDDFDDEDAGKERLFGAILM